MLAVALSGTAWKLATEGGSMTEATRALKDLSKDRTDVVAVTAAVMAGARGQHIPNHWRQSCWQRRC